MEKQNTIGQILIKINKLNQKQLNVALEIQKHHKRLIGLILLDLRYITESDLIDALNIQKKYNKV